MRFCVGAAYSIDHERRAKAVLLGKGQRSPVRPILPTAYLLQVIYQIEAYARAARCGGLTY